MSSRCAAVLSALFALTSATIAHAQWSDFTDTKPFSTIGSSGYPPRFCTTIEWAPDGSNRLFVARQDGAITSIRKLGRTPQEQEYSTFAVVDPLYVNGETGVIGLAFDPDFQTNHFVYVMATVSSHEQQIIRYTDQGGVGTNKQVIVSGLPTAGDRHNGGALGVGPDGKLYWGIGDNLVARGVDDDMVSLASKIGRANLDGTVANDNPFFDGDGLNNDFIWARGVRNPFKLAFQPETGSLWLDVVGHKYEQVFVLHGGEHAGYIQYENDQPDGYVAPIIKYRTNYADAWTLAPGSVVRSSGVLTVTTPVAHGLRRGELIQLYGLFQGTVYVASTPSATTFTAPQVGADAVSGADVIATTQQLGGCLLGGTFYDATQFPAEYYGNYFFADCNSNLVARTVLSAPETVASVDRWRTYDGTMLVDLEIGPDGALYALGGGGVIWRAAYTATSQAIVVSNRHLGFSRGAARSLSVSLAMAPTEDVTVSAVRSAGSASIHVEPASRTFTPSNWDIPQPFTVRADSGAGSVSATVEVASAGLASQTVAVHARDPAENSFVTSTNILTAAEGQSGALDVALRAAPEQDVTVQVSVTAGGGNVHLASGSNLVFTAANYSVAQKITVQIDDDEFAGSEGATVILEAPQLAARDVRVRVVDNDPSPPVIDSKPVRIGGLDIPYAYEVHATGVPASTFQLAAAPAGMTIDAASGLVQWTPTERGVFSVSVVASNGNAPNASQSFDVQVGGKPSCWLQPVWEAVSGTMVTLQGMGYRADDSAVLNVTGEFLVDGMHVYTDEGPKVAFFYGGGEHRWDTTALTNGVHAVTIRVTNALGETCEDTAQITVYNPENEPLPEAGTPDGSNSDGATPMDAAPADSSTPLMDAALDASLDAAVIDAGAIDAGATDASRPNSSGGSGGSGSGGSGGAPVGGAVDAGIVDARVPPARRDAGADGPDPRGGQTAPPKGSGCDCRVGRARPGAPREGAMVLALAIAGLAFARTRRRRTRLE